MSGLPAPLPLLDEARRIGDWWLEHAFAPDGGLYGRVDEDNRPHPEAPRSLVCHARALWFFARLAGVEAHPRWSAAAARLAEILLERFTDPKHGGVYWSLDGESRVLDARKHSYAQAFAIYALSAWAQADGGAEALDRALRLFERLERHARDPRHGGWIEALGQDWREGADPRLSDKEPPVAKTLNTHLHIMEALSALARASGEGDVRAALAHALDVLLERFYDPARAGLLLFCDGDWRPVPGGRSWGHEIEFSWLLWEAAQALGDPGRLQAARHVALAVARACLEHHGERGELLDGCDAEGRVHPLHPWWVQAEALVGYLNAHALEPDAAFLNAAERSWSFIDEQLIDREFGEWHMYARLDGTAGPDVYKAGFWKGPYHNGRAMLEAAERLRSLEITKPSAGAASS